MRPWLVLKHFGIPFEEVLIPLYHADSKSMLARVSPSGKVPYLVTDAGDTAWESLAIMETIAEAYPDHTMWPRDASARARSISAEMHPGFADLRQNMPMEICTHAPGEGVTPETLANIARIEAIWSECLAKSGGPFLFGEFGIADAMFAPVVMRFHSYAPELSETSRTYMERICALPAVAEWIDDAKKEIA